ncbi:DER1-domain-containing protein [Auricularia subglabra TFB-10046 SS5]|nr:DER1-domain-containing protein [Auricularia subglabra TFB-10046 SS5]
MADQFFAELRKIPPVTRIVVASTLAVTLAEILQFVNIYSLVFSTRYVARWQIWRLYTTFFWAGRGISFLFSVIMLYRNLLEIEEQHYGRRSHDLAWQSVLAALAILALNLPLQTPIHFSALYICYVYLSSWLTTAPTVSLYGIVTVPTRWFPYMLLLFDVLQGGPSAALVGLTGCIVGHSWWLLEWKDGRRQDTPWGRAPAWFKAWVAEGAAVDEPRPEPRAYGGARAPPNRGFGDGGRPVAQQPQGYNWGAGNRLGS